MKFFKLKTSQGSQAAPGSVPFRRAASNLAHSIPTPKTKCRLGPQEGLAIQVRTAYTSFHWMQHPGALGNMWADKLKFLVRRMKLMRVLKGLSTSV